MKESIAPLAVSTEVVKACVERALDAARNQPADDASKQRLHAARSRNFVGALAQQLLALYTNEPDVRGFTKHDERNRSDFGMNELLYDVTICRTAIVASAASDKCLHYVAAPIWHVESEFAKDSRQALFDFNKLVLGAAPLNLFVGPIVYDPQSFIGVLRAPAACCTGKVFVALIPHPSDWDGVQSGIISEALK